MADQLRTDIAEYVQRVLMTEAWEETGEEVADRVMAMVKSAGWGPQHAAPTSRVFFPGDTVPAGVAAMSAKGVCMAAATVPLAVDGLADPPYVEVPGAPTWEEWQATVDRAHQVRIAEATAQPLLSDPGTGEADEGGEHPCSNCGTRGWDCLTAMNASEVDARCCEACGLNDTHSGTGEA